MNSCYATPYPLLFFFNPLFFPFLFLPHSPTAPPSFASHSSPSNISSRGGSPASHAPGLEIAKTGG